MLDQEFKLKPSKYYLVLMISVLLMTMFMIAYLPLSGFLKFGLWMILIIYGIHFFWSYGCLRGSSSVLAVRYRENIGWLIKTPTNNFLANIKGDTTVTAWASILRFRIERRSVIPATSFSCVIFKDALDQDEYRKLMILLKITAN